MTANHGQTPRARMFAKIINPTHIAFWTLLASVVTVITAIVAVTSRTSQVEADLGAPVPVGAGAGSTHPTADAAAAALSAGVPPGAAGPPPSATTAAAPPVSPTGPRQTRLYTLPGNSAGQLGQQRAPFDVVLAGARYPESTGVWTGCAGGTATTVTFYLGGAYQKLSAIVGVADFAPADFAASVIVLADEGIWKEFEVSHDQSLPIDLDVSGRKTIGFYATSSSGCPSPGRPFVYLGDAVVSGSG